MAIVISLLAANIYTGDWKCWSKYHSTLLYWIICTLLYEFLTRHHPLWRYNPELLINHTMVSLFVMFIVYPLVIFIYLPHFPKDRIWKKVLYVFSWVLFSTFCEWLYLEHFLYFNGWSLGWSFILNLLMFPMLKLHYHKPLLTYLLSPPLTIGFLIVFQVPV